MLATARPDPVSPIPRAEGEPNPPLRSMRVFFVGHSLVNHVMPKMLRAIAASRGVDVEVASQIIDGSPLEVQWEHPERSTSGRAIPALSTGRFDTLVLAEAVDLDDMLRYHRPAHFARRFYEHAERAHPGTRVFLLEAWHDRFRRRAPLGCASEATWRTNLVRDRPKWRSIVDAVNARGGGPPMRLVPAATALGRLVDAIHAGRVPGVTLDDVFFDGIHMDPLGNYFVALVHFATLARTSPEGATLEPRDEDGRVLVQVPERAGAILARLAWEVARDDGDSGVRRVR